MSYETEKLYSEFLRVFGEKHPEIPKKQLHITASEKWRKYKSAKSEFPQNVKSEIQEMKTSIEQKKLKLKQFWVKKLISLNVASKINKSFFRQNHQAYPTNRQI